MRAPKRTASKNNPELLHHLRHGKNNKKGKDPRQVRNVLGSSAWQASNIVRRTMYA